MNSTENRSATEMNRIVATMDDLPELPFEKVLSYLSLEDRLKARAVSRRWYHQINRFRVKSLCCSDRPSGFIMGKSRWISGAFANNFISSTRFASFFDTFGQTILSSLKRLRLCDIDLSGNEMAFMTTLNSFSQLEQLDIIRIGLDQPDVVNLNLPMLTSFHLEDVGGIEKLTLEAPRLREVELFDCYPLRLDIVPGESVESLLVGLLELIEWKNLKNVQYMNVMDDDEIDSMFLSSMEKLKEFHTDESYNVSKLFDRKQQYAHAHLKIFLRGLLLNGPNDPAIHSLNRSLGRDPTVKPLVCLAENRSRLADEIPSCTTLYSSDIEELGSPGLKVDLLKRFTNLNEITANSTVRDIQGFLDILKNRENISKLSFWCDQPQDLFDRLPEHCAVQKLMIWYPPCDLAFLFRLKHLIWIYVHWPIDSETVRRAFEELPFLDSLHFGCDKKRVYIYHAKQFRVYVNNRLKATVSDLNAAIELIT